MENKPTVEKKDYDCPFIIRGAFHAGGWYSSDKKALTSELNNYLLKTEKQSNINILKGMIVPHAGLRWSGPTAAWGYVNINPNIYMRVVLLGPSHHSGFVGLGLSKCNKFETPLGDISLDTEEINKLALHKGFQILNVDIDEAEHSLEMQFPYLRLLFNDKDFKLLPIMVGQTNLDLDKQFAKILLDYYLDKETLFVISSDFCHWGSRFRFTYHDKKYTYPHESIEFLDKLGMEKIESQNAENFANYLAEYKNTICGRRPISIFLAIIEEYLALKDKSDNSLLKSEIKFVKYDQSEKVTTPNGSSVSYAVGLNFLI